MATLTYKTGSVKTAPIHFGEPDILKKFRYIIANSGLKGQSVAKIRNPHDQSLNDASSFIDYEATVELTVTQALNTLEVRWEHRYTHRPRVRS